jgi:hypothetical protein
MIRTAILLVLPVSAAAAPIPEHLMPRLELQLRHNPNDHPLGNKYEIVVRNTGASDLQIWTDRPHGLAAFLDYEIVNAAGDRVSRSTHWARPADEGEKITHRETIPAKKSFTFADAVFQSVEEKKLVPGRYKVRVRFHYKSHNAVSEWLPVDISESEIRTKNFVLGP